MNVENKQVLSDLHRHKWIFTLEELDRDRNYLRKLLKGWYYGESPRRIAIEYGRNPRRARHTIDRIRDTMQSELPFTVLGILLYGLDSTKKYQERREQEGDFCSTIIPLI